jgi:hypothetical protein
MKPREPVVQPAVIDSSIDHDYLAGALGRAGASAPASIVEQQLLLGGRTGARVVRLLCPGASFVVKDVPAKSWRSTLHPDSGEAHLWLKGITRVLQDPITCPVLDVGYDAQNDIYRLLMADIASGIRGRGAFTWQDSERLFRGLAVMHASQSEEILRAQNVLPPVSETIRLFSHPVLHMAGRRPSTEPWVHSMLEEVQIFRPFVPLFLDVLGPTLADAYLDLAADSSWQQQLDSLPGVLLHGDLRRANIALGSSIELIDWEFAAIGPAAADLQWHCLLHYWGYPPTGMEPGASCTSLRDLYADAYAEAGGQTQDPRLVDRSWKLGWLKAMTQLGFVLADPLFPDGGDAATRKRVGALCARAVQQALDDRAALP